MRAIAVACVVFLLTAAVCAADTWDKSSLSATGRCLSDGSLQVTVTNNGSSMTGAVAYRFVVAGEVVACGAVYHGHERWYNDAGQSG